jgi:PPOX class probable F420-dependent enzyme
MPMPESARAVIESGRLAHLVTLNRDGSPQVTCVWVGTEGDEIVAGHLANHQKLKNVRRDPRVSVSIETENIDARGLQEYLVVYGTARVTEGGGPELLTRLAHTYIGLPEGEKFPPIENPPAGYVMHITPERFSGIGPWAGG